jgi:hypothetical protein
MGVQPIYKSSMGHKCSSTLHKIDMGQAVKARLVHKNSMNTIVQVHPVLSNNRDTYWSSTAVRMDRCRMHSMPVRTLRKVVGCVALVSFVPHNGKA